MPSAPHLRPTSAYHPRLAALALVAAIWVFVLVVLGAFTTSINAGMAFPDWPLSNGSLNPTGWLSHIAMFAEHSHRLSAGLETLITLTLAIALARTETRGWLRRLGWGAFLLILVQAAVGGLRVLCDRLQIPVIDTSLGRIFAMLHACLAQVLVCALFAIALACTRRWLERPVAVAERVRRLGAICCGLLFVQLAIAAIMRHSFAGLAIPTFPWSTAEGGLLPSVWSFKVAIHFAHRAMAAVLAVFLLTFASTLWRDRQSSVGMRTGAAVLINLLCLQIILGASIIWTHRDPAITTAHVLVGALTLATTFGLTWLAHRDPIEQSTPLASP